MTFGGSGLDRASETRIDAAALARLAARPGACSVLSWRGKLLMRPGPDGTEALVRLPLDHPALRDIAPRILLGREDGEGIWTHDLGDWTPPEGESATIGAFVDPSEQAHPEVPGARFVELRGRLSDLTPRDAELAATARAVTGWHASHAFCSACGRPSEMADAGWRRVCPACGTAHFPRTDPVVIMLVLRGDRVLLGRNPAWPEGMFSLLAGFVEPGETIEAAVRREVREETGVAVGAVRYLASQPWPFPASLMFGCAAEATSEAITVDPVEIEAAEWVDRERMARILRGVDSGIRAPRKGAIAGFLLAAWVAGRLD